MVRVQCVCVVLLSAFIVGNIIFISLRVKVIFSDFTHKFSQLF